jgi:hypothetical protein
MYDRNCIPLSQCMANQMMHCAFSCVIAIILTAAVAVLITAESSSHMLWSMCKNMCVCVCVRACMFKNTLRVDEHITVNPFSAFLLMKIITSQI